jgi:hypothetical protein
MAVSKLLNLIALSSLAIMACSFGPNTVNALATDGHAARHVAHGHQSIVKKKRSANQKRCKTRSVTPTPSSTSKANDHPQSSTPKASPAPAPTKSSSKQPAPTSNPAPPSHPPINSPGKKAALAWPNGNDPSLYNFITDNVGAIYTWSPDIPQIARQKGLQACPQLWGDRQTGEFQQKVVKGYANCVLGMNEPNEPGQSNMNGAHGAQLWKQYIEHLGGDGYLKVSPATSGNPNGIQWMHDFLAACNGGCNFDAVAIHWYDTTPEKFIAWATLWHDTFKKPIWVTEFACQNFNGGPQCSKDQVFNFMTTVVDWMEKTPWVEKYFAFGAMKDMQGVNTLNSLMTGDGKPTPLGNIFLGN